MLAVPLLRHHAKLPSKWVRLHALRSPLLCCRIHVWAIGCPALLQPQHLLETPFGSGMAKPGRSWRSLTSQPGSHTPAHWVTAYLCVLKVLCRWLGKKAGTAARSWSAAVRRTVSWRHLIAKPHRLGLHTRGTAAALLACLCGKESQAYRQPSEFAHTTGTAAFTIAQQIM